MPEKPNLSMRQMIEGMTLAIGSEAAEGLEDPSQVFLGHGRIGAGHAGFLLSLSVASAMIGNYLRIQKAMITGSILQSSCLYHGRGPFYAYCLEKMEIPVNLISFNDLLFHGAALNLPQSILRRRVSTGGLHESTFESFGF